MIEEDFEFLEESPPAGKTNIDQEFDYDDEDDEESNNMQGDYSFV